MKEEVSVAPLALPPCKTRATIVASLATMPVIATRRPELVDNVSTPLTTLKSQLSQKTELGAYHSIFFSIGCDYIGR
jgi:hypothetical protein